MAERFKIAIVGSGPGGLSAAARAAERGESHVLLEAEDHLSNTIYRYQKGKFVMDEPGILPLRSPVPFKAGSRETILGGWDESAKNLKINVRYKHEVSAVKKTDAGFDIKCANGQTIQADFIGKVVPTKQTEIIKVMLKEFDDVEAVGIFERPIEESAKQG